MLRKPPCRHLSIREGQPYGGEFTVPKRGDSLGRDPVLERLTSPDGPGHDVVLERQLDLRPAGLRVDRIVEQGVLHLGVDALGALVQLPDPAEFNQRARDTRVARIAGGPHVVERHDVRERPRAEDLQTIVEHRDPDVVAPERVAAMGHRLFPLSSNTFPRSERLLLDPWSIRILTAKSQDFSFKTAGNGTRKVSMLRGSVFTRSLLGKVLDLAISCPKDQTAPPSRHAKPAFSALSHRHPKTHPTLILAQESLNL